MGKMIEEQHVQVLQHDDRFKFWGPPGPNPLILPPRLVEGTHLSVGYTRFCRESSKCHDHRVF